MTLLKLFGCAAIALSGLVLGLIKSKSLFSRRDCLKRFDVFLEALSTDLRYNCEDIFTSVNTAAKACGLDFICVDAENKSSFYSVWSDCIGKAPRQYALQNSDKELLTEFGERLGKTDLEGQLSHIELCRALLQKQINTAEEAAAKSSRLYKTLGIFGGVCAAILIC